MPLHTFKCDICKEEEEILIPMNKLYDKKNCLKCNGINTMVRQFPKVSKPIFKGSGFYETDYKKKGKN